MSKKGNVDSSHWYTRMEALTIFVVLILMVVTMPTREGEP